MALPDPSALRYTYGDYVKWEGPERWELVDGEPHLMSPAPAVTHQVVVGAVFVQVATALRGKPCRAFVAPIDVRLPEGDEADGDVRTIVQPDVLVVCDRTKVEAAGVRGAPDWILEVVSPSTRVRDRVVKRDLYSRHGVREYWILDPDTRTVEIYERQASGFGPPRLVPADGILRSRAVDDLVVDWSLVWAELE